MSETVNLPGIGFDNETFWAQIDKNAASALRLRFEPLLLHDKNPSRNTYFY